MDQHFAIRGVIERLRADLVERMGQLEIRMIERMADLHVDRAATRARTNVGAQQAGTRTARWMISLFLAQTSILVGTVLGIIQVLR